MRTGHDIERTIAGWLTEEAPARAPDRILRETNARIDRLGQRRARSRWRWLADTGPRGAAAATVIVAFGLAIAFAALGWLPVGVVVVTPTTTPSPAPSAAAISIPAPSTIDCPYVEYFGSTPPSRVEVSITNNTPWVVECHAIARWPEGARPQPVRFTNPQGDATRLEVLWEVPAVCSSMPAELELWRALGRFLLNVNRLEGGDGSVACRPAIANQGVLLDLGGRELLAADDIEAMVSGVGVASVEVDDKRFDLTMEAALAEYAADETIDVQATLSYLGPDDTITVFHGGHLLLYGVQQLPGGFHVEPLDVLPCIPTELRVGDPIVQLFMKSGGFSESQPNADFFRRYFQQPELVLPPGIWRIYAIASFEAPPFKSPGCGGGMGVSLTASTIVRVR